MFVIDKNNDIRMSKGETVTLTVPLKNPDGTSYTMTENDTLKFSIKKSIDDTSAVLGKTSDKAVNKIELIHTDTSEFEAGLYKYDILLTTGAGGYFYVVEPHTLEIVDVIST